MTPFSRRLNIFFVVVGLLGCIVIFVARMSPQDAPIPGLAMCGDRLCYLGIVPGKTTYEDAKLIIESHLKTSNYQPSQSIENELGLLDYAGRYDISDGLLCCIDLYQNAGTLSGIVLNFHGNSHVNLASFTAYLGQPTSVTVRRTIAQWVNYPSGSLVLPVWDAAIAPYTAVDGVYLSSTDQFSGACDTVAWYGYDLMGYRLPPC